MYVIRIYNYKSLLRYSTISSIKKIREIIHFEIFTDWCAILFVLSIIQLTSFYTHYLCLKIAFQSYQFPSVFILLRKNSVMVHLLWHVHQSMKSVLHHIMSSTNI